ncbi:hypothetical protein ACUXCC_000726 [Cytobacillus horneckiae]
MGGIGLQQIKLKGGCILNHLLKDTNENETNDNLVEEDCSLFVPDSPFSLLIG